MAYLVTIKVPTTKLTGLLAQLREFKAEVQWIGETGSPDEPTNGKSLSASDSTIITLGSREPAAGTVADRLCGLVMALEGKAGPGNVTRNMLNQAMVKCKPPFSEAGMSSGVANAVTAGYLKRSKT